MADIIMPEKKSGTKSLFQVAGTAVGGYFGGPQGAAMGYQAGGAASDMLGKNQQPGQVKSDAIQRRIESQQPAAPADGDHMADLAAAEAATAKLPEEEQKKYLPALQQARAMSAQQRRTME